MTIYCTTNTRFKAAESLAAIAGQRALSPNAVVEQSSLWLRWPSPATRENFPARSDGAFGTALDVGLATGQRHQLPLSETAQGFHLHRRTPHSVDHAPPRPVRAALPCGLIPRPQAARRRRFCRCRVGQSQLTTVTITLQNSFPVLNPSPVDPLGPQSNPLSLL